MLRLHRVHPEVHAALLSLSLGGAKKPNGVVTSTLPKHKAGAGYAQTFNS